MWLDKRREEIMEIVLNKDEARALAGIGVALSKEKGRLIYGGINFDFATDQIVVTATDSYRLVQHFLPMPEEAEVEGESMLVEGGPFVAALKQVKTLDATAAIRFASDGVMVQVCGASNASFQVGLIDAQYPNVGRLMRDVPWDDDWSRIEGEASAAFIPTYLSQMAEALGAKRATTPVRMLVQGPRKPAAFKFAHDGRRSRGLLMAVIA